MATDVLITTEDSLPRARDGRGAPTGAVPAAGRYGTPGQPGPRRSAAGTSRGRRPNNKNEKKSSECWCFLNKVPYVNPEDRDEVVANNFAALTCLD